MPLPSAEPPPSSSRVVPGPLVAARQRLAWIYRTKLKVLAWVLGITLAAIGSISLAGIPWLPAVGVAFAAAAMSVGKATGRLNRLTCLSCGRDLSDHPIGVHGIACTDCGAVNQPRRGNRDAPAIDDDQGEA
jgi:hypothetical protein